MTAEFPMRINKYLAQKGHATRKDADTLIERGLVSVNDRKATLGQKVHESDKVRVRGKTRTYRYYVFNKPVGVITHSPQLGEKDVLASSGLKGVFPVGRLDKASSGLLILTDDARVTDRLLSPNHEHEKEYRVRTREKLPSRFKERIERGVDIEGYTTKPCTVAITGEKSFRITLTEGKKHQIRRMCATLGAAIFSLERVRVLNIKLAAIKPGEHRELAGTELNEFLRSLRLS